MCGEKDLCARSEKYVRSTNNLQFITKNGGMISNNSPSLKVQVKQRMFFAPRKTQVP